MDAKHVTDDRSRGDRTAARLEAIAVDLVLEHGLQNVTVDDHDVIAEAMRLIIAAQARHGDRELLLKRKQLIHMSPALSTKHMERMRSVRKEMCELVYLRLKNSAPSGESEEQTRQVATVLAELSAVLLRLGMEQTPEALALAEPDGAGARLQAILARGLS